MLRFLTPHRSANAVSGVAAVIAAALAGSAVGRRFASLLMAGRAISDHPRRIGPGRVTRDGSIATHPSSVTRDQSTKWNRRPVTLPVTGRLVVGSGVSHA